ncbi:MAG: hypothetical protein ACLFPL_05125 [Candidatus Nanoarchaeia archaeon]
MLIYLLVLIDIHTLFVLLSHSVLPISYVLSGFTLAFVKGLVFYLIGQDLFSLIDMIVAVLMLLLLFNIMPIILYILISLYLLYKIIMSIR